MTQYEIWWADLPPPAGRRPVLLLTRPEAYEFLVAFLAAEVTTRVRGIPQELSLGRREGLRERSVANFDNLRTVHRHELDAQIGSVSPGREPEIKRTLGHVLGWSELTMPASE